MTSGSRALLVAVALAVVVRVGLLVLPIGTGLATKVVEPVADASEYLQLGGNIVEHRVFSRDEAAPFRAELFRTPGYPLFIAPFFLLDDSPLLAIIIAQIVLSLLLVTLVFSLCRELELSNAAAGAAAMLVAVSPNLAFLSTKTVTETLFCLLLVLCLLLFNRYRLEGRVRNLVATGVCSGLLVLIRPIAIGFPLLLGLLVLYGALRGKVRFWHPLLPLLCAALVVAPWVMRNGRRTGRLTVSTAAEHNLYLYNAATVVAAKKNVSIAQARDIMRAEAQEQHGPLNVDDEARFWSAVTPVAWRWVRSDPVTALKVQALGFVSCFVTPVGIQPLLVHAGADVGPPRVMQRTLALLSRGRLREAALLLWQERLAHLPVFATVVLGVASLHLLLLLAFGLVGLVRRGSSGFAWLLLPVLYFTLLAGPVGEARFRAPIEPLLCLFAGVGLAALLGRDRTWD